MQNDVKEYIGNYYYRKIQKGEITEQEAIKRVDELKLKRNMGYKQYYEMKKLGLEVNEYEKYIEEKNKNKLEQIKWQNEKDNIRNKTKYFFNKYCNCIEKKCQVCGNKKIQLHHPNYYDYLKINILCIKHHRDIHKGLIKNIPIIDLELYKMTQK